MNQVAGSSYFLNSLSSRGRADLAGEHAALDVRRRVLAAVRTEPAADGVDVDTEHALDVLGHASPLLVRLRRSAEPAVARRLARAGSCCTDLVRSGAGRSPACGRSSRYALASSPCSRRRTSPSCRTGWPRAVRRPGRRSSRSPRRCRNRAARRPPQWPDTARGGRAERPGRCRRGRLQHGVQRRPEEGADAPSWRAPARLHAAEPGVHLYPGAADAEHPRGRGSCAPRRCRRRRRA